ncbi:VOC family protein [Curtobacterium flaccumfaciens]|uniref:VOC family protein n=1 Tax=Curtobacterium flaccumfaciens TaxID=2035 RepID=UPI001BDEE1E1|nr:VOC family protein [Curtobacterium flaccumfaciens]MBT1606651.1 VOC family protein [Curtobacterium flaccumfaciens pv. betae]MBT1655873.1 VOC family protein [Curtobacterium flaccumfaciens pv. betae]MCS0471642.1 VOC family protein [Curtobacterium flaccumfaciens pv. betae]MCS0473397.1 VOC family protein [Curtobacterium flaccumfaciens pv. betae]MCS0477914.1 VOC family protein [Curtobacterium flaccumfaciens pv. betae]
MQTHELLAADTGMGAVTLRVADLDAMIRYYRDGVRLSLLSHTGGVAVLGRGSTPIVVLEHAPAMRHAAPREAGLFHTAILFDTRADLAAALYSVATQYPAGFTGSADHLVSNAFYFTDPEGNGVELYWDRDRTEWSWTHGMVDMDTKYVDPNAFLQSHLTQDALDTAAARPGKVGHVHLSVGDVATARSFYVDTLGFETTAGFGEALFVSAGGYHHHMAMNTWNSRGAGRRQLALGLGLVRIEVPAADDLGALTERMRHGGVELADDGRTVAFDDPWANRIEVTTPSRA